MASTIAALAAAGGSGESKQAKKDKALKNKEKRNKQKEKKKEAKLDDEKTRVLAAELAAKKAALEAAAEAAAATAAPNGDDATPTANGTAPHTNGAAAAAAAAMGDGEDADSDAAAAAAADSISSNIAATAAAAKAAAASASLYAREEQDIPDELRAVFAKFATPAELATREDAIDEFEAAERKAKEDAEQAAKDGTAAGGLDAGGKKKVVHIPIAVDANGKKLSRKERKRKGRMEIAELKQAVARPDVVEMHDTNSSDPKLLVFLKAYRNSVMVPKHWSMKRKYLQGKRGIEKPAFALPQFIADTGIAKVRGAMEEKAEKKGAKGKARDKMQVKMGKMDIDYQVLHDAFFRYQTKPKMSEHGQMYYEGKEMEVRHKDSRPGHLSEALRNALGMAHENSPPPWLVNMQRFGPPPCYPNLRVPGVNAPIPEGARWGFSEGEWGQAPIDAFGRPLYGDVYGQERKQDTDEVADKTLWGLIVEEEEEPESEEDEKAPAAAAGDDDDDAAAAGGAALGSVSAAAAASAAAGASRDEKKGTDSVTSHSTGAETPLAVPLRKSDGTGTETPDAVRALYTVLQEKTTSVGGALFGTSHTYVVPPTGIAAGGTAASGGAAISDAERKLAEKKGKLQAAVDIALTPEELEGADAASLKRKYDAANDAARAQAASARPDVSDVVDEENRKKKRKMDKDKGAAATGAKKKSGFKF